MKTLFYFSAIVFIVFSSSTKSQWVQQTLPGDINVTLGIDFLNQNHGITGGWYGDLSQQIYGKAYYTYDGGSNWIEASVPDSMRVMVGVQMINENLSYGVGAYNLTESKAGVSSNQNQYQNLNPALRKYYEQIGMDFSGQENYRGYFVETTDSGLTWYPKGSFEDSVYYLVGIYFIDEQTGYVIASSPGASSNTILKTSDGGNTWDFVFPFQYGFIVRSIRFFEQIGYLIYEDSVLGSVFVTITTDGGMTWSPPFYVGLISASKVSYANVYTILISGVKTQFENSVFKSTDGGASWYEIRTYDIQHYLSGVDAAWNTNVLLVYGTDITPNYIPFVDISLDGGVNWNYSQLSQFQDYIPLYSEMVDETRWYITGTQNAQAGFVLFTDNSGGVPVELVSFTAELGEGKVHLKWTTATELNNLGFEIERKSDNTDWRMVGFKEGKGTTTEIQNYYFTDDLFGLNRLKLYYRLKQIDFNNGYEYSEKIEVIRNPISFELSQNYPNPFNPTTTIRFSIPTSPLNPSPYQGEGQRERLITLKVYDVLGKEVATLVNEESATGGAGSYEIEFSAKGLPSGIYFYQLRAGSFVQTKKMILVK